jgi:hypothetical protein
MTSTQILNTQLIDGLVQTLLALSLEERQLLFQQRYGLSSQDFYAQFLTGTLGDAEDYIEWAGFYELLQPQGSSVR